MSTIRRIALVVAMCAAVPAQAPAPSPKDAAHAEIAKAVRKLDTLLAQIEAARAEAKEAALQIREVASRSKEADLGKAATLADELQARIEDLGNAIEQRSAAIRDQRAQLAAEAPVPATDPLADVREQLNTAAKAPSLADVQKAIEGIEKDLLADDKKGKPGVDSLLNLVRYRLADTLRQRAGLEIKKGKDRDAERMMQRANTKYAEVLAGEDSATSGEGSSLHAAALRRILQIEGSFYEGYKQLSARQPASTSLAERAQKHRHAILETFEKLNRLHPDATLPDGQKVVDAARADANRVSR